jgi:hypothetical protein
LVKIGAVTSFTVTVAVWVDVLPDASVAVTVTELAPKLEQSKDDLLNVTVGVPQLSVAEVTTFALVRVAVPLDPKFRV